MERWSGDIVGSRAYHLIYLTSFVSFQFTILFSLFGARARWCFKFSTSVEPFYFVSPHWMYDPLRHSLFAFLDSLYFVVVSLFLSLISFRLSSLNFTLLLLLLLLYHYDVFFCFHFLSQSLVYIYLFPPLSLRVWVQIKRQKFYQYFSTGVTILVSQTVLSLLIRRVITKTSEAIPLLGSNKSY